MRLNTCEKDQGLLMSAKLLYTLMDYVTATFASLEEESTRVLSERFCLMLQTYCCFIQPAKHPSEFDMANSALKNTFDIFCEGLKDYTQFLAFSNVMKKRILDMLSVEVAPELGRKIGSSNDTLKGYIDVIIHQFFESLSQAWIQVMIQAQDPHPENPLGMMSHVYDLQAGDVEMSAG